MAESGMMNPSIIFEIEDQAAYISLNRPEKHNAINQELLAGLYDSIERVGKDDAIKVAVITGMGKSFCSGIDLDTALSESTTDPTGNERELPDLFAAVKKPLIGAINGHTITGGLELALHCDFLIASERAFFTDSHARLNIHPGWGVTQLLQQAIGPRRARQMSFSCEAISATRALEWGLVNEVVPHELLIPRARQIARSICNASPSILSKMKALIRCREKMTHHEAFVRERESFRMYTKNAEEYV